MEVLCARPEGEPFSGMGYFGTVRGGSWCRSVQKAKQRLRFTKKKQVLSVLIPTTSIVSFSAVAS